MAIQSYRDLDAWKVAMDGVVLAYQVTALLPDKERYGLCSQMQRAAVSIPSNVAEAHGRKTDGASVGRGTIYFLRVALGSIAELDTQLETTVQLGFVSREQSQALAENISRIRQILSGMRRREGQQIATKVGTVCLLIVAGAQLWL